MLKVGPKSGWSQEEADQFIRSHQNELTPPPVGSPGTWEDDYVKPYEKSDTLAPPPDADRTDWSEGRES